MQKISRKNSNTSSRSSASGKTEKIIIAFIPSSTQMKCGKKEPESGEADLIGDGMDTETLIMEPAI